MPRALICPGRENVVLVDGTEIECKHAAAAKTLLCALLTCGQDMDVRMPWREEPKPSGINIPPVRRPPSPRSTAWDDMDDDIPF
jgi:hypothetical protein